MNYIDLSCPAEIFRTAMPTEEVPAATVTLFNLSDRVIVSAEVLLRLLDEDGGETERLAYRGRALNGRPHSTFLMTVPCAPAEDLHSIDVIIEKVWYADNEVWRREPGKGIMYIPNNLPVSPALTKLKYAALPAERTVDLRVRPAEPGGSGYLRPLRPAKGYDLFPLQSGSGGSPGQHEGAAAGSEQPEHAGGYHPPAADPGGGI